MFLKVRLERKLDVGKCMTVVETKLSVKKQQSKKYLLDTEEKRILNYQVPTADKSS